MCHAGERSLDGQCGGGGSGALAAHGVAAPAQMGLYTRAKCLEYLGSLFRGTLAMPVRFTDWQIRPCK